MSDEPLVRRIAPHVPPAEPPGYAVPEQQRRAPDAPALLQPDEPPSHREPAATVVVPPSRRIVDPTVVLPRPAPAAPGGWEREDRHGLRAAAAFASVTLLLGAGAVGVLLYRSAIQTPSSSVLSPGAGRSQVLTEPVPETTAPAPQATVPAATPPSIEPVSVQPVAPTTRVPVTTPTSRAARSTPPVQPGTTETPATLNPPQRPVPPTRVEYTTTTTRPTPASTTTTQPPRDSSTTTTRKR